jgi:hypothetical protein
MSRPDPSIVPVPALDASTPAQRWHLPLALALGLLSACTSEPEEEATTGLTGILTLTEGGSSTGALSDSTSLPTTGVDDSSADTGPKQDMFVCQKVMVKIPIVTPSVMLVLDKSGSMVADQTGFWDHDADDADNDGIKDGDPMMGPATPRITRWNSLHSVVDFIVTSFNEKMNLGAALFPSISALSKYTEAACPVSAVPEVKVAPMNAATILAAIPGADALDLRGGTPAAAGITTAVGELQSIVDGQPQFIVLVTDGAANCASDAATASERFESYDEHLPEVVAQANADKIPTFVVGIDIKDVVSPTIQDGNPDATNTYEKLNELAVAGGKARDGAEKFYNTSNQIELMAALESITEEILSCTFTLDPPPTDMQFVNQVIVGEQLYGIDQVEDCLTEDGWHFVDAEKTQIELCGAACTTFKMTGVADVNYDCLQL